MNRAIGIFDSGVGGLTVVREMMKVLPEEQFIYVGDTARVPYGSKSKEEVASYSLQILRFLETFQIKAAVIACNTASVTYDLITPKYTKPLFEIIEPGARAALALSRNKRIGVLGTAGTVHSKAHEKKILEKDEHAKVFSKACPLFVPLAEEGWHNHLVTQMVAELYITPLMEAQIDTLILGCTHYPLLSRAIEGFTAPINIIDPATCLVEDLGFFLEKEKIQATKREKEHVFYVSGDREKFDMVANSILQLADGPIVSKAVRLEDYA